MSSIFILKIPMTLYNLSKINFSFYLPFKIYNMKNNQMFYLSKLVGSCGPQITRSIRIIIIIKLISSSSSSLSSSSRDQA